MKEWKDVLPVVVSSLGNDVESHAGVLDFLRVLPEEVTEGRKITLSVCGSRSTSAGIRLPILWRRPTVAAQQTLD
jgi:hypothetical protein